MYFILKRVETYFLVEALKGGSLLALEKVYKAYYSKLYGFAIKFGNSKTEADDFVQQTFVAVWEKRKFLKEDVLFDKQIFVICKNIIINQQKRDQKFTRPTSNLDTYIPDPSSFEEDDEEEDQQNKNRLYKMIAEMPEKRKEIFLMHKMNNLSYEEISENLGISKKTIANHIYLATTFLKEKI